MSQVSDGFYNPKRRSKVETRVYKLDFDLTLKISSGKLRSVSLVKL